MHDLLPLAVLVLLVWAVTPRAIDEPDERDSKTLRVVGTVIALAFAFVIGAARCSRANRDMDRMRNR